MTTVIRRIFMSILNIEMRYFVLKVFRQSVKTEAVTSFYAQVCSEQKAAGQADT